MNLLLDTHALVWATAWSARLSRRVHEMLQDGDNTVWASAISAYEIELKRPRDADLAALPPDLDECIEAQSFRWLPVSAAHAITAGRLPRLHNDPFDRILAAQALEENMVLITRDPAIGVFGCVTAW